MGQLEALQVSSWEGLSRPGRGGMLSDRKAIDTPRDLINLHPTEDGYLWLPPAYTRTIHEFAASHGPIVQVEYVDLPRGIIIQTQTDIYFYGFTSSVQPDFPTETIIHVATPNNMGGGPWPVWVNSVSGKHFLVGYSPRGGGSGDGQTWRVEYDDFALRTGILVTDISANVPFASMSTLYKGRRFVVNRGRTVSFSNLNDFETFGVDSVFTLGGDDAGDSFQTNPGDVQGMVSYEDVFILFMTRSIWMLSGSGPNTWQLRQLESPVGCASQWTIVSTTHGVFFLGGGSELDLGIYVLRGTSIAKVSQSVDPFFRLLTERDILRMRGVFAAGRYIFSDPRLDTSREVYLYSVDTGKWTTFDGYSAEGPTVAAIGNRLYVTQGPGVYSSGGEQTQPIFHRYGATRRGRLVLGWEDDQHPTGHVRFLAFKLSGKTNVGTASVSVTSRTDLGVVSEAKDLTMDLYEGLVFPIQLRGHAIELEVEITPSTADQEVFIEHADLIISRKGEKVSRS